MIPRIRNAKKELLAQLAFITAFINDDKFVCKILCATIYLNGTQYNLKVSYTPEEYDAFIDGLDQDYDSRYSNDEMVTEDLNGTVWFEDGGWIERIEVRDENSNVNEGFGKWGYRNVPTIPENLWGVL